MGKPDSVVFELHAIDLLAQRWNVPPWLIENMESRWWNYGVGVLEMEARLSKKTNG